MPSYECALSVVDQIMPMIYTPMWLIFKVNDPDTAIDTIRAGLDRLVAQLPFLSGEVFADSEDGSKAKMRWSDDNPKISFEEVAAPNCPSYEAFAAQGCDLHQFPANVFPSSLMAMITLDIKRALIASYTKIEGGVLALLAPHHGFVDGGGQELLVQLWASNTKGVDHPTIKIGPQDPISRSRQLTEMIKSATAGNVNADSERGSQRKASNGEDPKPGSILETVTSAPSSAAPTTIRLFQFSVRKLEGLRRALRQHTQGDFSLNTMVTSLLWVTWIAAYVRNRSQAGEATSKNAGQFSELTMAVNARKYLSQVSRLEEKSWLGNLATHIEPLPRLELDAVHEASFDLSLEHSGEVVPCLQTVPTIIDMVNSALARTTPSDVVSEWRSLLDKSEAEGFDWKTVRSQFGTPNGPNLAQSNWGTLDLLPDFGPHLGRPQVLRVVATGAPAGTCLTLPRHRDKACGERLLDQYDVYFIAPADDMKDIEQNELLKAVSQS